MSELDRKEIQSFVRRKGKMSRGQKAAYLEHKSKWVIPLQDELLEMDTRFPSTSLTLEIGFGMGDATWQIAKAHPDRSFLGIEVHRPGVGKLLARIEEQQLKNLFIIEDDAKKVIRQMIPKSCLDGVHIFFPDPWPKKKHHKRRLIQKPFIEEVLDRIASDGYLYVVTDWKPYAEQVLELLESIPQIKNAYNGFAEPQTWRPETSFERKGLQKHHSIYEFYFNKK